MEAGVPKPGETEKTQQLKRSMFLDFAAGSDAKQQKFQSLLASPDLNMLKLASPELEKMLLTSNGMMNVAATPTPTSFVFPKYVTDEQEAYARGFVEALAQLHGGPGPAPTIPVPTGVVPGASITSNGQLDTESAPTSTYSTLMPVSNPGFPMSASSAANTLANMGAMNMNSSPRRHPFIPSSLAATDKPPVSTIPVSSSELTINTNNNLSVKQEPSASYSSDHRVPSHSPAPSSRLTDSPTLSPGSATFDNSNYDDGMPVDLGKQEEIKVERKRARNRIAARKCRTRKLERIARLEEKVNDLKSKNNELVQTATSLNEQVVQLKQQIMDHMKTGCTIMMPGVHNLQNVGSLQRQ